MIAKFLKSMFLYVMLWRYREPTLSNIEANSIQELCHSLPVFVVDYYNNFLIKNIKNNLKENNYKQSERIYIIK